MSRLDVDRGSTGTVDTLRAGGSHSKCQGGFGMIVLQHLADISMQTHAKSLKSYIGSSVGQAFGTTLAWSLTTLADWDGIGVVVS